jgi:hypothetical protein
LEHHAQGSIFGVALFADVFHAPETVPDKRGTHYSSVERITSFKLKNEKSVELWHGMIKGVTQDQSQDRLVNSSSTFMSSKKHNPLIKM